MVSFLTFQRCAANFCQHRMCQFLCSVQMSLQIMGLADTFALDGSTTRRMSLKLSIIPTGRNTQYVGRIKLEAQHRQSS